MSWQGTLTTKVLSGGGAKDVYATIQVQEAPIQSAQPTIVVTLSRLEGNTHNIWEAIAVKDGAQLTLTNIPVGSPDQQSCDTYRNWSGFRSSDWSGCGL